MSDDEAESYAPWNFSWVVEGELAAMACPRSEGNLRYLVEQGIRHLITLSPEALPPCTGFPGLDWTCIPVKEFEAPKVKDILRFIDICQRCQLGGRAIGVHCRMGRGRTGTMAACYLVRFQERAPERAIINVRMARPGSVETPEQERAVCRYHDCLRGTCIGDIVEVKDGTEKWAVV